MSNNGRYKVPICVSCQVSYRVEKNGVWLIELAWQPPKPYRIWACDKWKCPGCGHELLRGFSNEGKEHHQDGFDRLLAIAQRSDNVVYEYEA